MNNQQSIAGYTQLKKLRTALAILQSTSLLSTILKETEETVSHDQTKRVTYLSMLFIRIHREIFHDWKEQATTTHRPGVIAEGTNRLKFRKIIGRLVLDQDVNRDTAIFDNNGFIISTDNIAERLADFYHKMRQVRPFSYGNRISLDLFITALGHLPAFKAVYEAGIDFRRLAPGDATILHSASDDHRELIPVFQHALDPTRTRNLNNTANAFGKWPENKRFISGIPFLSHRTADGIDCLVTITGGLVPLNSFREEDFIKGQHFAENPLSVSENVIGYLPGTENLRSTDKRLVDAVAVREDGVAPLFCLDINMLTGLRTPSHIEFMELLRSCSGERKNPLILAGNDALKQKMLTASEDDERLQRTVEIAYNRVGKVNRILVNEVQKIFTGKKPDIHPKLFMCMGGAGSGKTAVEEIAQAQCGENFVIASLDEFRKVSDLYHVMTAAGHHSDDYVYVEPFANRLRDMVAKHAKEAGINLLYDGTGIPYQPRYSTIIKEFSAAGFHTQITAVDAFVVKPAGREQELSRAGVVNSVKSRYAQTGRALPWVVTIDKHIRAPRTFLNAVEDLHLDKISLFANDGDRDRHYLVAETFKVSERQIQSLHQHQLEGTLTEYLKRFIHQHNESVLKNMAANTDQLKALIERIIDFDESNVAYQIYSSHIGQTALLIYNTRRMVDFIEKRQLNPNASGEQGLLHKAEALKFHVDPKAEQPWLVRLQGSVVNTSSAYAEQGARLAQETS